MTIGKYKLHPAELSVSWAVNATHKKAFFFFKSVWGRWEMLYQVDKKKPNSNPSFGKHQLGCLKDVSFT